MQGLGRQRIPAGLIGGVVMMLGIPVAASLAPGAPTVLTATDQQVVFEVVVPRPTLTPVTIEGETFQEITLPGWEAPAAPGAPRVPRGEYLIALPPGAEAVVEVLEQEVVPLGAGRPLPEPHQTLRLGPGTAFERAAAVPAYQLDHLPEATIYEGGLPFPATTVRLGETRHWRHHRVVAIEIAPVQYRPVEQRLFWYPRLRVRVLFVPARTAEARPQMPYLAEEARWEPLFARSIVNLSPARGYRRMPRARANLRAAPRRAAAVEFRASVDTSGVYRITFEELVVAGLETASVAWDEVAVELRGYDDAALEDPELRWPIAFLPDDRDADERFGPGDGLIFYGQDAIGAFSPTPGEQRYGRGNAYWIVIGAPGGPTMESLSTWFGWEGLAPPLLYRRTVHVEPNLYYMGIAAADDGRGLTIGPQGIHTDHYNGTYPYVQETTQTIRVKSLRFDLPSLIQLEEVRVHLQGQAYIYGSTTAYHRPRLWFSRGSGQADTTWPFPGNPYLIPPIEDRTLSVDGALVPRAALNTGRNYVKIYLPQEGDGIDNVAGHGIGIDWVEITFDGEYKMRGGELVAPLAGLTGQQELRVRDVPATDLVALNVADPRAPVRLALDAAQFTSSGSSWELRLQIDCDVSPTPELVFLDRAALRSLPVGGVRRRVEEPLTTFAGEDYIAVYHERFAEAIEPLLEHRASQGHQVLRAPVQAVYDAYSGGRPHPYAIKRLLRRMWRESVPAPDYLLLVGDASNELAGYSLELAREQSDTSYVPTITVPGQSFGETGIELVSCDVWYADQLGGEWDDPLSTFQDLHVGRISCGTPEEAELYVEKVLTYEQEDPTAAWRERLVLTADDDFSSTNAGIGGEGIYRRRYGEGRFWEITNHGVASIQADSLFDHYQIDSLNLNTVMDSVVSLGRCVPDTVDPERCLRDAEGDIVRVGYSELLDELINRQYGIEVYKPLLLEALSRGALVWAFQGHSNRSLLTHEFIFRHTETSSDKDVFQLDNLDRPFLFMGYGCHLGDFASHWEGDSRRRDAMCETLLFCCSGAPRGGIGVLGSSDYERIGHTLQEKVFATMFEDPPFDVSGQRRWRMGELITRAKTGLSTSDWSRLTYVLLGDPALRLGLVPPMIRLALNGEPWEESGGEYVAERADDSLRVVIELSDEGAVGLPQVEDFFGLVPADSLILLAEEAAGRRRRVAYATQLKRRAYDLRVTALDYDGATRSVTVRVPMAVELYEQLGDDLEPLDPAGANLEGDAQLAVTVRSGAHLAAEDVRFMLAGEDLIRTAAELSAPPGAPFVWTIRYGDLPAVGEEEVELTVEVHQRDGSWLELARRPVTVGSQALALDGPTVWMPNPFGARSHLVYKLTAGAGRTRLRIYTASGRRILEDDTLPIRKGTRAFVWDGRDDDGDPVANGLYFYELAIYDDQGRQVERLLDKVIRAR